MPIVRMPDGKLVRFPDDMPREEIKNFITSKFSNTKPEAQAPAASVNELKRGINADNWLGALTKFDQGGSFGLGKKVGGIVNAVGSAPVDWVASAMGKENVPSFADRYNEIVQPAVESGERFEKEHPVASLGLELAGGLANPANIYGMKVAGQMPNFMYKLAALGGLGAITGMADTAGRYNSADKVVQNVKKNALTGAVMNTAFPLAGKFLQGGGLLGRKLLGLTTGTGNALDTAFDAGKRGSKTFLKNLRGDSPMSEVVDNAKEALTGLKIAKNNRYTQNMAKLGKNAQKIDVSPIRNNFEVMKNSYNYKGFNRADKATQRALNEVEGILSDFEQNSAAHDVLGLDALKQSIQDISFPFEQKAANSFIGKMANNIKNSIEKQNPGYAKTMRDYTLAAEEINELSKNLLGGGKRINTTTALGKMQRAFRNNAQSAYGRGENLIGKLGTEATDALAGQALNSWTPRGLGGSLGGIAGIYGAITNPATLTSVPLFSPRFMGEAAYYSGKISPILSKYGGKINPAALGLTLRGER